MVILKLIIWSDMKCPPLLPCLYRIITCFTFSIIINILHLSDERGICLTVFLGWHVLLVTMNTADTGDRCTRCARCHVTTGVSVDMLQHPRQPGPLLQQLLLQPLHQADLLSHLIAALVCVLDEELRYWTGSFLNIWNFLIIMDRMKLLHFKACHIYLVRIPKKEFFWCKINVNPTCLQILIINLNIIHENF